MDGWKTILSFWDGLFSKLLLLFLGRVVFTVCKVHVSSCEFSKVYTSHVAAKIIRGAELVWDFVFFLGGGELFFFYGKWTGFHDKSSTFLVVMFEDDMNLANPSSRWAPQCHVVISGCSQTPNVTPTTGLMSVGVGFTKVI